MVKKIYRALPYLVIAALGLAIAGLLLYILPYRLGLTRSVSFEVSDEPVQNPLSGFAPPAQNVGDCKNTSLVYIGLTWADWEPREGFYDIEGLEEKFHIAEWKKEKKHAVLRFVCDIPDDEPHMDIPDWLYEKTGDGTFYDISYGMGYAPDYSNDFFRERHAQAIKALADYCNQDYFVSYVELGSLGHWGEWHTKQHSDVPKMPDEAVCGRYVQDYTDHFEKARMLMRRNYAIGAEAGLGLYNDMVGAKEDTDKWFEWIREGGSYETAGKALEFMPADRFWERAPVGGELTSRYEMEEHLGKRLMETLDMIERCHMTFLGPNCPSGSFLTGEKAGTLRGSMGSRYYISKLDTGFSFRKRQFDVNMTWKNAGTAPTYWDWPVTMYLYDGSGSLLYQETLDLKLSGLLPGEEEEVSLSVPLHDVLLGGFRLGIGIASPDGSEHMGLAMDGEFNRDEIQIIYTSHTE